MHLLLVCAIAPRVRLLRSMKFSIRVTVLEPCLAFFPSSHIMVSQPSPSQLDSRVGTAPSVVGV
jgi:hypothetical protein